MDLVLFDRQGLEFVIVPIGLGSAFGRFRGTVDVSSGAPTPPRAVAVEQLRTASGWGAAVTLGATRRRIISGFIEIYDYYDSTIC